MSVGERVDRVLINQSDKIKICACQIIFSGYLANIVLFHILQNEFYQGMPLRRSNRKLQIGFNAEVVEGSLLCPTF